MWHCMIWWDRVQPANSDNNEFISSCLVDALHSPIFYSVYIFKMDLIYQLTLQKRTKTKLLIQSVSVLRHQTFRIKLQTTARDSRNENRKISIKRKFQTRRARGACQKFCRVGHIDHVEYARIFVMQAHRIFWHVKYIGTFSMASSRFCFVKDRVFLNSNNFNFVLINIIR